MSTGQRRGKLSQVMAYGLLVRETRGEAAGEPAGTIAGQTISDRTAGDARRRPNVDRRCPAGARFVDVADAS